MNKPLDGHEIIALLAPPIEIINHLEGVFEIHRQKNAPTPEACLKWLAMWQAIRSDGKTAIDGTTAATWNEVEKRVRA